jgi:hypothetical protein
VWALVLLAVAPGLAAAQSWDFDAEGRLGVGTGEMLATRCCPKTRRLHWAGVGGRVEASPSPFPEPRLVLAAQTDLRLGLLEGIGEENDQGSICHATLASVGFDSKYFAVRAGPYLMSHPDGRPWRVLPSAALRFGRRDGWWIALDLLDEPSCFLPTCLLGASYGIVFDDLVLENGVSLGMDKGRVWAMVPFESAGRWWLGGGELEISEEGAGGFLVAGVRNGPP